MTHSKTASATIIDEVTAWPGVEAEAGDRDDRAVARHGEPAEDRA